MPRQGRIENTIFPEILREFGIVRNQFPFELDSIVVPVALVATGVEFVAAPTPAYGVTDVFTNGVLVAPIAGTVMADTGPLPIGAYSVKFVIYSADLKDFDLEWRNAADSANLRAQRFSGTNHEQNIQFEVRVNIENANERVRVIIFDAGTAATNYQATIWARI